MSGNAVTCKVQHHNTKFTVHLTGLITSAQRQSLRIKRAIESFYKICFATGSTYRNVESYSIMTNSV